MSITVTLLILLYLWYSSTTVTCMVLVFLNSLPIDWLSPPCVLEVLPPPSAKQTKVINYNCTVLGLAYIYIYICIIAILGIA